MNTLLGVAGVVALLAAFVWLDKKRERRRVESAFAGRETLSDQQFFERYFRAKGVRSEVASQVRRILAEQLGQDLSRLQSSDDFTKNLKFLFEFDSLVDVEIVLALEEGFGIKITDEEAQAMRTVEDIVLAVHSKLPAAQ
jgi:acyl carrier protein